MTIQCGTYEIVNISNNKRYVGSSKNISKRWSEHKRDLDKNSHHSIALQRAWNKYGTGKFKFRIIQYVKENKNNIKDIIGNLLRRMNND